MLEGVSIEDNDGDGIPRSFSVEDIWSLGDEVFLCLPDQIKGSIRCYSRGVKVTFPCLVFAPELLDEFLCAMKVLEET